MFNNNLSLFIFLKVTKKKILHSFVTQIDPEYGRITNALISAIDRGEKTAAGIGT